MTPGVARFYVAGGTLPPDAVSYVARQADVDLLDGLRAGEFCYVLDTRQMGKSSLMVRTAVRLADEGASVLALDLTALGQNVTPEQWYDGLLHQMGRELDLEDAIDDFRAAHRHLGPLQRWMAALRAVALARSPGPLVVFIDEIDIVRSLPFSTDEFFAGIRECHNERARHPDLRRLTFCLLGVATPASLVRDTRVTPFNIGRRIDLRDFTPAEAAPLAAGMDRFGEGEALLRRVLWWTGGHPYLTQRLCQTVAEMPGGIGPADVDRACDTLFLSRPARERDSNLLFVRDRLLRAEGDVAATLDLYARVLSGRRVGSDDLQPAAVALSLAGVVRADRGRLRVRNRIYERVFDRAWVRDRMPDAERRRQRAAYRRGLVRASSLAAGAVLGFGALALTAVTYADRAQRSRHDADSRAAEARRASDDLRVALDRARALRRTADDAKRDAERAARLAEARRIAAEFDRERARDSVRDSRERSSLLMVAYGARLQDEGDLAGSLLWYAQAARADSGNPLRQRVHRQRLAATLRRVPRVSQMWFDLHAARFSPDGTRVLLTGQDGAARICDAATGALLVGPMRHGPGLRRAVYSADGHRAVTFGGRRARVWDTATGRPVGPPILCRKPISGAGFSRDARHVLCLADDYAELFEVSTGRYLEDFDRRWTGTYTPEVLRTRGDTPAARALDAVARGTGLVWLGEFDDRVYSTIGGVSRFAFAPDGKRVAVANHTEAAVFDVATAQILTPRMVHPGFGGGILALRFSPDGRRIVTCSLDATARIWDAATGQPVAPPLAHRAIVQRAVFSPDGRRVATASDDMTARVWDAATGRPRTPPIPHSAGVTDVSFDPSGERLLTVDLAGVARFWEVAGLEEPDRLAGEFGNVASAAFSPDGRLVGTGDFDYGARVWDAASGEPVGPVLAHTATVRAIAFSPDGRRVATGGDDHQVRVWTVGDGRRLVNLAHRANVLAVAFSPDGRRLLTATAVDAFLWDAAAGRRMAVLPGQGRRLTRIAFSPDGRWFLAAHDDGAVQIGDAATGRVRRRLRLDGAASDAEFHAGGRHVVTASARGYVQVWDIARGTPVRAPIQNPGGATVAALSPDGRRLLTANALGDAQLWDLVAGRSLGMPMRHQGPIQSARFSPDGTLVVTCSRDFTARVWDATTGQPVTPPLRHDKSVRQATFSPDGRRLLTTCDDGQGRLWQLPSGDLSPEAVPAVLEALSARRIEPAGGMRMLRVDQLRAAWRAVGSTRLSTTGPSAGQRAVWRLGEAVADLDADASERASRHLNRVVAAIPGDRQARALRLTAHARQGRWREVAADGAALHPGGPWLLVLSAHRPAQTRGDSLVIHADHRILVVLPAPARRLLATARVGARPGDGPPGDYTLSVQVASRTGFTASDRDRLHAGIPLDIALDGATAFALETRHRGADADTLWADGRIELEDGRTLRLADLPIRTLGGL